MVSDFEEEVKYIQIKEFHILKEFKEYEGLHQNYFNITNIDYILIGKHYSEK